MWLQTQGKAKDRSPNRAGWQSLVPRLESTISTRTTSRRTMQIASNCPGITGRFPGKNVRVARITNGSKLLLGIDGRSPWVRRCKDIIAAHLSDLGGADNTSAAERSTIRRAAVLTTELERFEVKFASAGEASTEDLDA
jgi:hypothetical protein